MARASRGASLTEGTMSRNPQSAIAATTSRAPNTCTARRSNRPARLTPESRLARHDHSQGSPVAGGAPSPRGMAESLAWPLSPTDPRTAVTSDWRQGCAALSATTVLPRTSATRLRPVTGLHDLSAPGQAAAAPGGEVSPAELLSDHLEPVEQRGHRLGA